MIGGTSTGGLIAIMLGRLGMTVDECINSYLHLSKEIFGKKKSRLPFNIKLELATQFDSKRLEDIIKKFDGASELLASGPAEAAKCKVVVCAVRKSNSQPAFLRSYPSTNSNDLAQYTTVWEACRATSAAPGFFDSIAVGPNKQELIDGGLGHNNPVETVYAEARDLWGPTDSQLRRRIACLISIGTGVPKSKTLEPGLRQTLKTLSKMVSDTQTTANRFRRDKSELVSNQQYFRFNVDVGLQGIGLEEHQKQAVIADATSTYLDRPDIKDQLVLCAKNLHNQPVRVISQPMKASQPMDSTADTDRVMSLDEKHRVQFSLAGVPFADKFVDRPEEMKAMSSRLLPSHDDNEDSGKRIYVLQGMGGIGKTQLAAAFFTRFGKRFSAAFWLKANTERDLRQSIARCARRIPGRGASENFRKTCADSPEEEQLLVEEVLDWLGRDDNRNWLLVFDNVDLDPELDTDRQAGAYDIVEYLRANHGAILVTTRLQRMTQLGGYEDGGESISSVGPDLGRQIFLKWFGASASEASTSASVEEIESLVGPEFLGGLPLAIAQAAVYMRKTKISLAEYRRRYKDMWLHVMDAAGGRSVVHGYHKSVGTTWSLSLKQVEEREPLAGSLVRMWAFLDHKDLWYGLLREVEDESDLYESFSEGIEANGPRDMDRWKSPTGYAYCQEMKQNTLGAWRPCSTLE
ncbi:FabD/lysophospholipase-like protein [Sarocladium strictum]